MNFPGSEYQLYKKEEAVYKLSNNKKSINSFGRLIDFLDLHVI